MFQNSTEIKAIPTERTRKSVIPKDQLPNKKLAQKKQPYLGKPVKSPELLDLISEKDSEVHERPNNANLLPDPNSDLLDYNPLDPYHPRGKKTPPGDQNSALRIPPPHKKADGRQRQMSP